MKQIISFKEFDETLLKFAGGKGASLIKMTKAGLPVPSGFVILSTIDSNEEIENMVSSLSNNKAYAVRSSAIDEDSENASFAGAYETVLDVKRDEIKDAILTVLSSANSKRVKLYKENIKGENTLNENSGIAVIVQDFIKPDFAGVLFTANPVTRCSSEMVGNYVCGIGEGVVSGEMNANEFKINALKYSYTGNIEFKKYAKSLYKLAVKIKNLYGCEQDIEWAVKGNKIYILQSRPITTLRRINKENYDINSSSSGKYLFTNTNVGEALPKVITPMMWSLLEIINSTLGLPQCIDNICGHPYANMSVIYSGMRSLGLSCKTIKKLTNDIAGDIPINVEIPLLPFNRKLLLKAFFNALKKTPKSKYSKTSNNLFLENAQKIMFQSFVEIEKADTNEKLIKTYTEEVLAYINKLISSSMSYGKIGGLFGFREELVSLVGEECANEICSNSGSDVILESMKPVLYIEKAAKGEISMEEYLTLYGHRSPDELEVDAAFPYEIDGYLEKLIADYNENNISAMSLKKAQLEKFNVAKETFLEKYPRKKKWFEKKLMKFQKAQITREFVRSKSVLLVCIMRKFLLQCGSVNKMGNDVFYLYFNEVMALLGGSKPALINIENRKKMYKKYKTLPTLPTVILGEIKPFKWAKAENSSIAFYSEYEKADAKMGQSTDEIRGFAGASGTVEGVVRVLESYSQAASFQKGEILVTTMTNIGWTPLFPKVKAIITDIGAPLSHAAIVAREFGIPCVVGCKNATSMLKTGDKVRVDGGKGIITKLIP